MVFTLLTTPPPNSRIPDFWIGDVISVCQHTPVKTGNQCAYNYAATTAIGCADAPRQYCPWCWTKEFTEPLCIVWWYPSHDLVHMTVKQCGTQLICIMIRHVDRSVHAREYQEITFHPLAQDMVFDVHMSGWVVGVYAFAIAIHA